MCQSIEEGGRRCRRRSHLEPLTRADLEPAAVPGRPGVNWPDGPDVGRELYGSYPADVAGEAIALVDQARRSEGAVTDALEQAVAKVPGARLDGLEYRLKSPSSLARKLDTRAERSATRRRIADLGQDMTDVLRYTVVVPEHDRLGESARAAVAELEGAGCQVVTAESSYVPNNPYKGLHLLVRTPSGDQIFELQVHSKASIAIKSKAHKEYEISRDRTQPLSARKAADGRLRKMYAGLDAPKDLPDSLGGVVVKRKEYR